MSFRNRQVAGLTRRDALRLSAFGAIGASASGWIEALAADTASHPSRRKSCILLWMPGGPSQTDTFDPKPGHANSGPFKPIESAVPGMMLGPHLPKLAKQAKDLAIVRSMSTKEGDHGRATYYLRTGYLPQGPIRYPSLGSIVANEFDNDSAELPGFVSIAPFRSFNPSAFGSGFLGPKCAPLIVGERNVAAAAADGGGSSMRVEDLDTPKYIGRPRADERLDLMNALGNEFLANRPGIPTLSHQNAYTRAVKMMRSSASKAFEIEERKRLGLPVENAPTAATHLARGACWPGVWSSAACRSSRSRSVRSTETTGSAGIPTPRTSTRSKGSAGFSTPVGRPS